MFISKVAVFHGDTWHHAPCLVFYVEKVQDDGEGSPMESDKRMKRTWWGSWLGNLTVSARL